MGCRVRRCSLGSLRVRREWRYVTMSDPATPELALSDYAVAYAVAGLEVFPVNPRSKRPLVSQLTATADAD